MTPEEKAVIDAAISLRDVHGTNASVMGGMMASALIDAVDTLIYSCPQCNAGGHTCPGDGNPISHTATDCGEHDPSLPAVPERPMSVENPETDPPDLEFPNAGWPADWQSATLLYVLAGDRIRIGQDRTDVLRSSSGAWHANVVSSVMPSGKTWDKVTPWEHTRLRLDLSANPGFREYPPNTPCEILCTQERFAILILMQAFPGSEKIS